MVDVPTREEFTAAVGQVQWLAEENAKGLGNLMSFAKALDRNHTADVEALAARLAALEAAQRPTEPEPQRLTWAPPELVDPIDIEIHNDRHSLKLDPAKDYRLTIRDGYVDVGAGRLSIHGGRNVVLIGGTVHAPGSDRPIYLQQQRGTMHLEGIHLTGGREGINLDQRHGATVQIQNLLVDSVSGSYSGHHADVLQTWAGPRTLRVDRLEGTTNYQGFFLDPYKFLPATDLVDWDLRNVLIRGVEGAAYCFWLTGSTPVHHTENLVFASDYGHAAWTRDNNFPDVTRITAAEGAAVNVLLGTPGSEYASPGYATT